MGRKGVSKRKPKRTNSGASSSMNHGSSDAGSGESPSSVQSLVNTRNAPPKRGSSNPASGSNKKSRQGR
jgi:hypothetical protein